MIIEDDFWIAGIHKEFVSHIEGLEVINTSASAEEAFNFLDAAVEKPDLILLDIYIPDSNGLTLFYDLKKRYPNISITIISAANDFLTISKTVKAGIFDYIIKAVNQNRLNNSLMRFKGLFQFENESLSQDELDSFQTIGDLHINLSKLCSEQTLLPKGIDAITLEEIQAFFEQSKSKSITATDLGTELGISRSTARRYLEYLISIKQVEASLNYGKIGRPERVYTII